MTPDHDELSSIFEGPNAVGRLEDMVGSPALGAIGSAASLSVEMVLSALPVVGGPLSTGWSGTVSIVLQTKRDLLVREMARRLDILSEAVAGMDVGSAAEDPRFVAAAQAVYQQMLTEHDEEKIRWLANAAAMSGRWSPLSDAKQRYFLKLAIDWQVEHVVMLKIFANSLDKWGEVNAPGSDRSGGELLAEAIFGEGAFESKQFLKVNMDLNGSGFLEGGFDASVALRGHTELSPAGEEFVRFLEGTLLDAPIKDDSI